MKQMTTCVRLATVIVLGILSAGSTRAQTQCSTLTQVTDGIDGLAASFDPNTDATGRYTTFYSFADLVVGSNLDLGSEVFLLDSTTQAFTQISDNATDAQFSAWADISGDGRLVAFSSDADLIPGSNPENNLEVFTFDVTTSTLVQITDTTAGNSFVPRISGDASRIALYSTADLVAGGNADGSLEIYWYDVAMATFHQVTTSTGGGNAVPAISADGAWIVFTSDIDLVAGGNADGNREIFLYEIDSNVITQVTDSVGGEPLPTPTISGDGDLIAFIHHADLVPGGNPTNKEELYLYRRSASEFEQITSDVNRLVEDPALSADGRTLAYSSFIPGIGDPMTRMIFFDTVTSTRRKAIAESAPGVRIDLSDQATDLFFYSFGDLTGNNPDQGAEIFVARCSLFVDDFESGDLSAWNLVSP